MTRIALVAGEASGDLLGADLVQALRARIPGVRFEGVAGPRMTAQGVDALFGAERLAVMGLVEPLARLPELLGVRRRLARRWTQDPPDLFVGIDAPDFNLALEAGLRRAGVPTVHYVSPSVWAWRRYRLRKIARAVDLMLTLFPFEARFYEERGIPVRFVGHPLADRLPLEPDAGLARRALGLDESARYLALLPGSRDSEVRALAGVLQRTAVWLHERRPDLRFLVPLVGQSAREIWEEERARQGLELPFHLFQGRSRTVMEAADTVLLASGTATLEALLLKRPMVVTYRMHPLSYRLYRRLVKVEHVALPNLLAGTTLVPELLQDEAVPERLGPAVLEALDHGAERLREPFERIHRELKRDASASAAEAIAALLEGHGAA